MAKSNPRVVCLVRHAVDCDDNDIERVAVENEICEVLARESRSDGVHYQVGMPASGAVGWYDADDFRKKFKFVDSIAIVDELLNT